MTAQLTAREALHIVRGNIPDEIYRGSNGARISEALDALDALFESADETAGAIGNEQTFRTKS